MKHCNACGQDSPETEFHKDRSRPDGLCPYCKACHRAKQRDYQKRPPRSPAPAGMKACSSCKDVQPLSAFYSDATQYGGRSRQCKACAAAGHRNWRLRNLEHQAAQQKRWREQNRNLSRDHDLKRNYGIEPGTYDRMLAVQDGRCAICKTDRPNGKGRFHVDHCHDTGRVRGLLCHSCNVGIGSLRHSTEALKAAIDYLAEGRTEG